MTSYYDCLLIQDFCVLCIATAQITFSADGKKLYVACEGEPDSQEDKTSGSDPNKGANPSGHFDIVNVFWNSTGFPQITGTKSLNFQTYIDSLNETQYTNLLKGIKIDPRVTGGKRMAAKDIEPEYIALSDDGLTAYVTLQVGKVFFCPSSSYQRTWFVCPSFAGELGYCSC